MEIREAVMADLPAILELYEEARQFMKETGNPHQWGDDRPAKERVIKDIEEKKEHVCTDHGEILGVFYFAVEDDPTYHVIEAGEWENQLPYGVVHRLATSRKSRGLGRACLNWAFSHCGNLRIDTHTKNLPMRHLLAGTGFSYRGIIYTDNGTERLAFQKTS